MWAYVTIPGIFIVIAIELMFFDPAPRTDFALASLCNDPPCCRIGPAPTRLQPCPK